METLRASRDLKIKTNLKINDNSGLNMHADNQQDRCNHYFQIVFLKTIIIWFSNPFDNWKAGIKALIIGDAIATLIKGI